MAPRRRFFADPTFNVSLVAVVVTLLGVIAYGTLSHQGDFARPFFTMLCLAPLVALVLVSAVLGRLLVGSRREREQAEVDRLMAKSEDDARR
ncbi:MAG: hypothetical protein J0L92_15140 [Deltaproteobacteria bacterium]|nr:hypothetical protein [Deltaproteobacteria bacterium]